MKLHLTSSENNYLITSYGLNDDVHFIAVNKQKYEQAIIVMPDKLILNWPVTDFASLNAVDFDALIDLKPEVVLLGTGKKHWFLPPNIAQNLTANNIPLECMTTAAACRTYNILMSEGRKVAAALLI